MIVRFISYNRTKSSFNRPSLHAIKKLLSIRNFIIYGLTNNYMFDPHNKRFYFIFYCIYPGFKNNLIKQLPSIYFGGCVKSPKLGCTTTNTDYFNTIYA